MDFERIIEQYSSGNLSLSDVGLLVVFYLLIRFLEWGAVNSWKAWNKSKLPNSHDLDVWKKINSKLNHHHNNIIEYWRKNSIRNPFPEYLLNLEEVIEEFTSPSPHNKFLENTLEKRRVLFFKKAKEFTKSINNIGIQKNGSLLTLRNDCSTGGFPEIQNDLDSKAKEMVAAYDKLTELIIKKISNKKVAADA